MKKETESPYGKKIYQSTIRYSRVIADSLKLVPGDSLPDKIEYLVLFYVKSQYYDFLAHNRQSYENMEQRQLMAGWKKEIANEYHGKTIEVKRKDYKGEMIRMALDQVLNELELSGFSRTEAEALLQAGIKLHLEFYSYEAMKPI